MQALHLLLAFAVLPATIRAQLVTSNSASITASPTLCPLTFVSSCLSVAVVDVCGNIDETSCVCGPAGQGPIATSAASCLLSSCPYNFLISLATDAGTFCSQWIYTHTLTGSALLSAQSVLNSTYTSSSPSSFSTLASSTNGSLSITVTPTTTSGPSDTSSSTAAPAPAGLPLGAEVGIGIGAFAILSGAVAGIILCRRHKRRTARARAADAAATATSTGRDDHDHDYDHDYSRDRDYELATEANAHELADKRQRMSAIAIPPQELEGFQFPFRHGPSDAVEADSRSVRAGQARGHMVGTETTAFDFETQKVLLTPVFVRTPGSRAASVSTTDSGRRVQRPGTAASGQGSGSVP
jgi:hypothetical protein